MKNVVWMMSVIFLGAVNAPGQEVVFRVATYNVQFLDTSDPQARFDAIKRVIGGLDAHAIALQEIDNRAALLKVFDDNDWQIVIDDDSRDKQDVAVAIRSPLKIVKDTDGDGTVEEIGGFDAADADFLFPSGGDNSPFPRRRDILHVQVLVPDVETPVHLFVVHAKARGPSRPDTNFRRVAGDDLKIELSEGELPLNNSGDEISLFDGEHRLVHKVSYSAEQASPGVIISFGLHWTILQGRV